MWPDSQSQFLLLLFSWLHLNEVIDEVSCVVFYLGRGYPQITDNYSLTAPHFCIKLEVFVASEFKIQKPRTSYVPPTEWAAIFAQASHTLNTSWMIDF